MTRIIKSEYIPEKCNLKSFYRPTNRSVNKFDEESEQKNTFLFAREMSIYKWISERPVVAMSFLSDCKDIVAWCSAHGLNTAD
jgi:hypothetical protein